MKRTALPHSRTPALAACALILAATALSQAQDDDLDGIPNASDPFPAVNAVVADPDGNNNLPAGLSTGLTGRWDLEALTVSGSYHRFADIAGGDQPLDCRQLSMSQDNSGMISKAALFDGTNDHLAAPGTLFHNLNAFTTSMWFKTTPNYVQNKVGNIHTVFFACNGALDAYPELIVSIYKGVPGSTTQKITVNRYNGTTVIMTFFGEIPSTAYVDDGRWHHLAYVKNGNNNRLFIDGVKIKESNATNGTLTSTSSGYLCFGKNVPVATDQGHTFRGSMDRLRFYNRNLSDTEVSDLFRQDSDRDLHPDLAERQWTGYFSMSPFYWQSPEVDTDGDGLPDAWEHLQGLDPLSPNGIHGGAGDPDADGVPNVDEFQNGTFAFFTDTDADGASDAVEIAQGSDPKNPGDGGLPPVDPLETVSFRIGGDYSTWRMNIKGLGPRDTRELFVTAPKFNEFIAKSHKLQRNNAYRITLRHIASRPQDNPPWFCWEAQVEGQPATGTFPVLPGDQLGARNADHRLFLVKNHWIADNRQGLLSSHLHSKGTNVVGSDTGSGTGSLTAILMPLTLERDEDALSGAWQPISGQLAKALPGERINLQLNTAWFSQGLAVNDFNWALPATTFSDYAPTAAQAQRVGMQGALLTQNPVEFHFAESGNQPATVNFKVDGMPFQASTNIDVQKPVSTFTTQTGAVRMGINTNGAHSLGFFGAATPTFGVEYISSVSTPQGWSQGHFVYAQLIRYKRNFTSPPNGGASFLGDGVTWKHDGGLPYGGATAVFAADGQAHGNIGDSPSEGADASRYTIKAADSFQTYLMFKPAGAASRYVPLRKINWNWGGEASAANNWTVVANPVSAVDAAGAETTQHPEWNANAADDQEQNGN